MADQNNRPKVSIVVPTYNRIDFLKECLQSIDDQTFRDFELIVVDDASSDETEAFLHSRPLTQYIRLQQNQGVSKARNVGVRLARGQYICFLDSDDLWLKDKLKIQAQWKEKTYDWEYSQIEARVELLESAIKNADIVIKKVGSARLKNILKLTGEIGLNEERVVHVVPPSQWHRQTGIQRFGRSGDTR